MNKITLVHDLGNVVKFDLDKNPEFLGEEQANINYWKDVQRSVKEKYGTDDHEVTKKMLEEVGATKDLVDVVLNKSFGNSKEIKDSDNWPLKILYYADMRTLPLGVGTLKERMKDVRERMTKK